MASDPAHLSTVSRGTPVRHHPRQEPGAVIPPAGICAGGGGQPPSLPRRETRLAPRSDSKLGVRMPVFSSSPVATERAAAREGGSG
jgi:hypothetical protein